MISIFRHRFASLGRSTRFDAIPRFLAGLLLLLVIFSIFACGRLLSVAQERVEQRGGVDRNRQNQGDLQLFEAIVKRVHQGEGYYRAFGIEARQRDYGTRSVLNWRTPLHLWSLGQLPGPTWRLSLLAIMAIAAGAVTFLAEEREAGVLIAVLTAIFLTPLLLFLVYGFLFAESWAGVAILLSIGLAGLGCRSLSILAGLLALFVRELAIPYVIIAGWLAWRSGRRAEWISWLTGLALYFLYFAVHFVRVTAQITEVDKAYPSGWVQFGGPVFVLQTMTFGPIGFLPLGLASTCIPLAILGLAGARGEFGLRAALTTASFLFIFLVVGKPFNDYWGILYLPLLGPGLAWAPAVVRDLIDSLVRSAPASGMRADR